MNIEVRNKDERFISLIVKHPFPIKRIIAVITIILFLIFLYALKRKLYNNMFLIKSVINYNYILIIISITEYFKNFIKVYKVYIKFELFTNLLLLLTTFFSIINIKLFIIHYYNSDIKYISIKFSIVFLIICIATLILFALRLIKSFYILIEHKLSSIKIKEVKSKNSIFSQVTYEFEVDGNVYSNKQGIYNILLYQPMEVDFKVLYNPRFPNFNKIM